MKFRRKEDRSLCAELLEICWKDENGRECKEFATLEDISREGLGIGLETEIPIGTDVTVFYPNGKYEGQVRHCRKDALGIIVGIKFSPGYSWSRKDFCPSHLVQFRLRSVQK